MDFQDYKKEVSEVVKRINFHLRMDLEYLLEKQLDNQLNILDTQMSLKFEYNHYKFKANTSKKRLVSFEIWIREKLLELEGHNRYFIESVRTASIAACKEYGLPHPQFEVIR